MALLVVGLTGGIACGKSTIAGFLREDGVPVVDADEIARAVVEPGRPAHAEILAAFGAGIARADGTIDRAALARVVFADAEARRRLEAITHPRIVEESIRRFTALAARGERVAVYEASLLVETGRWRDFAALLVVSAPPEAQISRLVARDGLSDEDARARLAAQMPLAEKEAVADAIVRNDADPETARARTREAWRIVAEKIGIAS